MMRVLIVEDDGIARRHALASASSSDYVVETAEDGETAWAMHEAHPYDIILADWLLPGMDGLELCRRVHAMRSTHFTYLVVLTAKRGDENLAAGIEAGADDFLSKPYRRAELRARLEAAARMVRFVRDLCPSCRKAHSASNERHAA